MFRNLGGIAFPVNRSNTPLGISSWETFMFEKVLQLLSISCSHRRMSQPFTAAAGGAQRAAGDWEPVAASGPGHYVVCLECGKKFGYDWSEMRIIK